MDTCSPGFEKGFMVLCEEKSESRRGLHKRRRLALVIDHGQVGQARGERIASKPLYAVGEAYSVRVRPSQDVLYVQVDLVMNPRRRVKGTIEIYTPSGEEILGVKYEKLKLRISRGDPRYGRVVEQVAKSIGLPYKNASWLGRARKKLEDKGEKSGGQRIHG